MKKLVPDPPSLGLSNATTANTPFGTNRMFNVREGIPAEEALLHAGQLLRCAEATVSDRWIISPSTTAPSSPVPASISRLFVR